MEVSNNRPVFTDKPQQASPRFASAAKKLREQGHPGYSPDASPDQFLRNTEVQFHRPLRDV